MPHLVRYCGSMGHSGPDGRTAYEGRKGRTVQRRLPPFAEVVLYRVPETTNFPARAEERWLEGIFVGVRDESDEVFVFNERVSLPLVV